jgi:hypothetical protein
VANGELGEFGYVWFIVTRWLGGPRGEIEAIERGESTNTKVSVQLINGTADWPFQVDKCGATISPRYEQTSATVSLDGSGTGRVALVTPRPETILQLIIIVL